MACPFMASAAEAAEHQPAAVAAASGAAATCPFMKQMQQTAPSAAADRSSNASAAPAVCPLGFGTARGPRLSSLHCPICRGLLFEAHTTAACKHTFCQACISQAKDCPVCGQDIEVTEPNGDVSGLVDTFLDTHSRSPELVAAQADLGPLPDNSPASFFMAQGLKSLAGGNVHAALHRLSRCREALLESAATATAADGSSAPAACKTVSTPHGSAGAAGPHAKTAGEASQQQTEHVQPPQHRPAQSAAAAACQLSACCGCLADCYMRLGESSQAEQLYQEAISSVAVLSESDAEAAHTMSVSLNKLGDLKYMAQQLHEAKKLYRQGLELRQLCCGPLSAGQAGPAEQLELATSLIKVADACKALGEAHEAGQMLHRAQGVCFEVKLQEADLAPALARKLNLLLSVLHAQAASSSAEAS